MNTEGRPGGKRGWWERKENGEDKGGVTYKPNTACTRRKMSKTPIIVYGYRQKHSNTERTAILYLEV